MDLKTKLYNQIIKSSFTIPIKVKYWNGEEKMMGEGEPQATIIFNSPLKLNDLRTDPILAFAEGYMSKQIEVEGSLEDLLVSAYSHEDSFFDDEAYHFLKILQKHDKKNSSSNIEFHYDIGNDFYRLWLDKSMTYSCGYFKHEDDDLETAQTNKVAHILSKLRIKSTDTLLDIGCGWGNLLITAAKKYGIHAVGCTLSREQESYVKQRIQDEGLSNLLEVRRVDYRDLAETGEKYSKIVSVGMFEHVGKKNIGKYFKCIHKMMPDNGLALIHGISGQRDMNDDSLGRNTFLNKYIFPGGYIPSLAEIINPINELGMHVVDLESLRYHYALTLEEWRRRFVSHWDEIEKDKGEEFMRMWDLYLIGCAAIFKAGRLDVCQYLIEKGTDNTRPLTRDYME